MVEFAIVLPILLLLICGIIDFGLVFSTKLSVNHYAREGARFAAVNATQSNIVELTTNRVHSISSNVPLTINVSFSCPTAPRSGDVIVEVTQDVKSVTPVGAMLFPSGTAKVTGKLIMKVE